MTSKVTIGVDWVARLGPPRPLYFVVQDDVNALALLDERDGTVAPLVPPAGAGGRRQFSERRGNKAAKMDLEVCTVLPDGRLLAIGSGSISTREHVVVGGLLRLFQRGNGAVVDGRAPSNAVIASLHWGPP